MRAIEISEPGEADVLAVGTRPVPEPGEGEILVRVAAAGVNRPDVAQRKGVYPPPPGASDIPGLEIAGEVAALGAGVGEYAVGDEVCALVAGGGYAEYCVAPVPQVLPVPAGMDMVSAAGIPETFFTVWSNIFDRAGFAPGESVLIHGGSSGIGTTAIQLCRALGAAAIYTTVGSAEKAAFCEKLGATMAIDYKTQSFDEEIKARTDDNGVDVILDMVGGEYLGRNISVMKPDGRLVQIALMGGAKAEINLGRVMMNRLTVTGSTLRARSVSFKGEIAAALREKVWPMLESGDVAPVIHRTFPLEEAAAAHALMEESSHIGKIILTTG
ncbi:MAG: NAD(P)H-quinone oxidoreductase [Alphaproteobacteria bacterium]|nr:NAD(P)H-quinone oxidoreductase [Alphaproteobacteria bacterium]